MLTPNGAAEPISRDQILRRERDRKNVEKKMNAAKPPEQ